MAIEKIQTTQNERQFGTAVTQLIPTAETKQLTLGRDEGRVASLKNVTVG